MTPQPSMRPCPGRCRLRIPPHLVACRSCWRRLPVDLRERVEAAGLLRAVNRDPYRVAAAEASRWLGDNPAPVRSGGRR